MSTSTTSADVGAQGIAVFTYFSPLSDSPMLEGSCCHGGVSVPPPPYKILFSKFVLPFEVTSFILIAALIGVIAIVNREPQEAA